MTESYEELTRYLEAAGREPQGEWVIDTQNDGTLEHPIQVPYVSYSKMAEDLMRDIYAFDREHPEYHMNQYSRVLAEKHIEWGTKAMLAANPADLDADTILALLMGAVRADRFCEGAFLNFLEEGAVEAWLKRLQKIDRENQRPAEPDLQENKKGTDR